MSRKRLFVYVQWRLKEKKEGFKRNTAHLEKKIEGPKEMSRYNPKTGRIKKAHRYRYDIGIDIDKPQS